MVSKCGGALVSAMTKRTNEVVMNLFLTFMATHEVTYRGVSVSIKKKMGEFLCY